MSKVELGSNLLVGRIENRVLHVRIDWFSADLQRRPEAVRG